MRKVLRYQPSITWAITLFILGFCTFVQLNSNNNLASISSKSLPIGVKNLTSKLEVVETKQLSEHSIQLKIRNGYDKDITAIIAAIGDKQFFRRDYIYAEIEQYQKLATGEIDDFVYTSNLIAGAELVIKAVLFRDMTKEGDESDIQPVVDKRLGMKIQLSRFKSFLDQFGKEDSSFNNTRFNELKSIAESLPIKKDDSSHMSTALELGLRHGREFILTQLSSLQTALENNKAEIYYQGEQRLTKSQNGFENFQSRLQRIKQDHASLLKRL
jgi:hypothetical protein